MKTIKIDKSFHRGGEVVLIQFPYDKQLGEEATLFNTEGKQVWKTAFATQSMLDVQQFQLPALAAGQYHLHLTSAKGSATQAIFVK